MNAKQEFIGHIAQKLGRPTPTSLEPVPFKTPQYRLNSQEERVINFLKVWESLGGKGVRVSTSEEAAKIMAEWFGEKPDWLTPTSIVTWSDLPVMARASLNQLNWPSYSYPEVSADKEGRISAIAKAELGITGADYGIAQSATLVLKSDPKRGRAVSLVPPRHLTFLAASTIRDSLDQVMEELMKLDKVPAGIDLISGPSRTSDIEMDLSIGVHGPIEVYLIIMDKE